MAGVFNEVEISWKGKTYFFTPSNRLLRRIEGQLAPSSLTDVINRISEGKPPISEAAFIIAEFLKAGGADNSVADEDAIYGEIVADFERNQGKGFLLLCEAIMLAISPSDNAAKKRNADSAEKPVVEGSAQSTTTPESTGG